ncbi:MAG: capsular biosynthesis protein [Roseibium sp.]|uniref:capsule biosynthesis protein n=1 Tax=Roseibium sp. TaxID=1936156 RepID=UPI00262EA79B|nr:capsular biosynthesis protein [Roseibium sp.]MCV0425268.1 capsular biosynthesis protein [Roseibium sp.]
MSGADEAKSGALGTDPSERRILFLQGPLSPLFKKTGEHLKRRGFSVFRINFCAGDWLHWHGEGCDNFKGTAEDWPNFVTDYLKSREITDLVLHGDQRLYHRIAIEKAHEQKAFIAVTELGALRPGWMTLERNGLSTLSHFPSDPELIREIAMRAGEVDLTPRYPSSFWLQTAPDVVYNLTNVFLKPLYPHYQRHTIHPPVEEYLRGGIRLIREKHRSEVAAQKIDALKEDGARCFVLPLQLEGDFQLRRHSPFQSFKEVLEIVLGSLAENAPEDTHLVIKSHPLDVGFEDWSGICHDMALSLGLGNRIHFLGGGGLAAPFEVASGVVTLNSTAGLEALQAGVPVKTLVPAHYDVAGLTHQGDLAGFWHNPQKPDRKLLDDYVQALAVATQVRGSIHNKEGVEAAARNIADRIADRRLNQLGAFIEPPPRLERARELGVPL